MSDASSLSSSLSSSLLSSSSSSSSSSSTAAVAPDDPSRAVKQEAAGLLCDAVTAYGVAAKALLRSADVHEENVRIARALAANDTSVASTRSLVAELAATARTLNARIDETIETIERCEDVNAQLRDTAAVYQPKPIDPTSLPAAHSMPAQQRRV